MKISTKGRYALRMLLDLALHRDEGYIALKDPKQHSVGEILRITEGDLCPISCLQNFPNECPRAGECMTLFVWEGLYKTITDYLDGVTLQDIIDHAPSGGGDFCI